MKIKYIEKYFYSKSEEMIRHAESILDDYADQGFKVTLRQLFYQLVAKEIIPNTEKEYAKLGNLMTDARLAGRIDWGQITDRTRGLTQNAHWESPKEILQDCSRHYRIDKWAYPYQLFRPEVWIEKEALVGVIEDVCREWDVAFFACRGYASQTSLWEAGQRFLQISSEGGQMPVILYLGDHDPSGKDMARDIKDRLALFCEDSFIFERIALNPDQIEKYNLPPNPVKLRDRRAENYLGKHGNNSWELDALSPSVMVLLIESKIKARLDFKGWQEMNDKEEKQKKQLRKLIISA